MKCPLFLVGRTMVIKHEEGDIGDCLKEECAWWSQNCKMCSMKALSMDMGFIAGTLSNIETKMPHEEQFRK